MKPVKDTQASKKPFAQVVTDAGLDFVLSSIHSVFVCYCCSQFPPLICDLYISMSSRK